VLRGRSFADIDAGEVVFAAGLAIEATRALVIRRFCEQQPRSLEVRTCRMLIAFMHEHPFDEGLALSIAGAVSVAGCRNMALSAVEAFARAYELELGHEAPELKEFLAVRGSALLQQVLESSSDVVAVRSVNGTYLSANDSYAQFYACENGQAMIGRRILDIALDQERAHQIVECDRRIIESGEAVRYSSKSDLACGERHWFDVLKMPLFGAEGAVVAIYVHGRDITALYDENEWLRKAQQRFESQLPIAQASPVSPAQRT